MTQEKAKEELCTALNLCYPMVDPIESARRRGIELAKVQVATRIRDWKVIATVQRICQMALQGPRFRTRKEVVNAIIEKLREDPELISLENDSSKLASFKLREDPSSMIQVSSDGAIVFTVASPSSYQKLYRRLLEAIWSCGLGGDILEPLRARIYRVEEYPVRSSDDIRSLIGAQTILGARGRRRDQEED
jgi:hypothetical protein